MTRVMKSLFTLLFLGLGLSGALAQDNTFKATTAKPANLTTRHGVAAGEKLQPKATGVIIMMSEKGLEVLNPLAPAQLGKGEKQVTKNIKVTSGDNNTELTSEDKRTYGGIILIGLDF